MSHLIVKKDEAGKFRIWNKNSKAFEGKPMTDEKKAQEVTKARDTKEDVMMKADKQLKKSDPFVRS